MALLDLSVPPTEAPDIVNGAVVLRLARAKDFEAWAALREESREHLIRWEPDWPANDMTRKAFRQKLRLQKQHIRRGSAWPLLVFIRDDETLVGGVSLTQIRRGASQSATLGYWVGAPFTRKGYASAAVEGILGFAFERLRLNRVEAACQPRNEASRRLLEGAGFQREGMARDYLRINGFWRDHLLHALTSQDYCAAAKTVRKTLATGSGPYR